MCPRSGPNGVGARGSPEGCRAASLWACPARTNTFIGAITGQVSRESSGWVPPSLLALPNGWWWHLPRCRSVRGSSAAPTGERVSPPPRTVCRLHPQTVHLAQLAAGLAGSGR